MGQGAVNVEVTDQSPTSQGPFNASSGGSFNTSGWTVATSGSRANGGQALPEWMIYAAVAVAVVWLIKRKRRG